MNTKPKILIDFLVRQSWLKMSRTYNQFAQKYGVSMSVGYILLHIDKDGTQSTQLGPKMGMEPTSLSRTLKLMETEGLIRREEDTVDKRKVKIFLTEKGLQNRYIARDITFNLNNKIIDQIPEEELIAFQNTIQKIDSILEDQGIVNYTRK